MAKALSSTQAKPSQLAKPVPGDELATAAAEFMAKQKPVEMGAADASVAEVDDSALEGEEAFDPVTMAPQEVVPQEPGMAMQALDGAGRALDYAGGFMRTGIANVAGMAQSAVQGKNPLTNQLVTEQDLKNAAVGKAPSTAEYLERMGVPKGYNKKLGPFEVSVRGAAGLAGDIATDPLTVVARTFKEIPYLGKLANGVFGDGANKATEALGEAVYASSLAKVDAKLARRGTSPVSKLLIEEGAPVMSAAGIEKKVADMSNVMGKMRQALYDRVNAKGIQVSTDALPRAERYIKEMYKDPGLAPAAEELLQMLGRYKAQGVTTIEDISKWKTNLYDALPASAFAGVSGKVKNQAKGFKAALAADFRGLIVDAGNKAEKGLGDSINKLNEKWGTLLEAQQAIQKGAMGGGSGSLGHVVDGAVLAGGGAPALAAKKAYDIATGTTARTAVGRALMAAGKHDIASRAARQGIATATRAPAPMPPEEPTE